MSINISTTNTLKTNRYQDSLLFTKESTFEEAVLYFCSWIDNEDRDQYSPNYSNEIRFHYTDNDEFVNVTITVLRFGYLRNMGYVVARMSSATTSYEQKTFETNFRYTIDRSDKDLLVKSIVAIEQAGIKKDIKNAVQIIQSLF